MQDVARLLAELERLDGAAEAAVVRGAIAAGVAELVIVEQLEREIARRQQRVIEDEFYDR